MGRCEPGHTCVQMCVHVCLCVGDQANAYSLEGHLSSALGVRPPRSELGIEGKDGGSQAPPPQLLLFSGAPEGSLSSAWGCGHGVLGLCVPHATRLWVQVAVPPMACPACGGLRRHARFRLPQLCPSLRLTVCKPG